MREFVISFYHIGFDDFDDVNDMMLIWAPTISM